MLSSLGNKLKISVFGESHAPEIGVIINGFPKDKFIDKHKLQNFLDRRKPGKISFPHRAVKPIYRFLNRDSTKTELQTEKLSALL